MSLTDRTYLIFGSDYILKKSLSSVATQAEYSTLKFLAQDATIRVPQPVRWDSELKAIRLPRLSGVLLVDLLRNLQKLELPLLTDESAGANFRIEVLKLLLRDLDYFHSKTNQIISTFPENTVQTYPYTLNFYTALDALAQFSGLHMDSFHHLKSEVSEIGRVLEDNATVVYRDAGLYNILVEMPAISSSDFGLAKLSSVDNIIELARYFHSYCTHIDFETSRWLLCPEDDFSFLLESNVFQNYKNCLSYSFDAYQLRPRIYQLAAIYRNIRVAARHAAYLFDHPRQYHVRYEHYGSAIDESPLNYLSVARSSITSACGGNSEIYRFVRQASECLDQSVNKQLNAMKHAKS